MENYEKKYKEALERANKIINDKNASSVWKGWLCNCFPELKESEDERIRKELINYFIKGKEYLNLCSFSKEEILAWLEKQGEKKPYGQREECFDCQDNYAGECRGSCAMKKDEWVPKKGDVCKPKKGGNNILLCDQDGIAFSFVEYVENGYAGGKISIPTLLKDYELVEPKDYNTFDVSFNAKDSELQEASYHIPEGYYVEIKGNKLIIKKDESILL